MKKGRTIDGKAPRPQGNVGAVYDLIADAGDWVDTDYVYTLLDSMPVKRGDRGITLSQQINNALYYGVHNGYLKCWCHTTPGGKVVTRYEIEDYDCWVERAEDLKLPGSKSHTGMVRYTGSGPQIRGLTLHSDRRKNVTRSTTSLDTQNVTRSTTSLDAQISDNDSITKTSTILVYLAGQVIGMICGALAVIAGGSIL